MKFTNWNKYSDRRNAASTAMKADEWTGESSEEKSATKTWVAKNWNLRKFKCADRGDGGEPHGYWLLFTVRLKLNSQLE